MMELYDEIGVGYRNSRRPDPRIATAIFHALGEADTVVNVGAGAGSYEPSDRSVIAVEPSMTMIRQRPVGSAPAVQASATHLPFRSATFEAAPRSWRSIARSSRPSRSSAARWVASIDRKSTRLNSSHVKISYA